MAHHPTRPTRPRRALLAALALAAIAAIVLIVPRLLEKDFRRELAGALGVPADTLHVNLPPARGRLPGFTFIVNEGTLLPLTRTDRSDPALRAGQPFTVDWSLASSAGATGSGAAGVLGAALANRRGIAVEARALDCQVLELDLPDLKRRLLQSPDVLDQYNKGNTPFVIVRAYEGRLELRLTRTGQLSAGAWAETQRAAARLKDAGASATETRVDVQQTAAGQTLITWTDPVVFAFEAKKVQKFITGSLGAEPTDVDLEPATQQEIDALLARPARPSRTSAVPPPSTADRWDLATIAMGHYPAYRLLDQDWNADSADLVERALAPYRPATVSRLRSTAAQPAAAAQLLAFARQASARAAAARAKLLVVYYIGHAVTRAGGDICLVQGDASRASFAEPAADPAAPLGPLNALAQRLSAELDPPAGLLRLAALHAALASGGVPFVLLVDGCMKNAGFRAFVESLGLTYTAERPTLYYVGAEPLTLRQLSALGDHERHFADPYPYLRATAPVVLAAKPGTVAPQQSNPEWHNGPPVGPLAAKTFAAARQARLAPELPPLGDLLHGLVDFDGTGEIDLDGSISWSDFSLVRQASRRLRPGLAASAPPSAGTPSPVSQIFRPGLGAIADFLYRPDHGGDFLLLTRNSALWRWNAAARRSQRVRPELPFATLGATAAGAWLGSGTI